MVRWGFRVGFGGNREMGPSNSSSQDLTDHTEISDEDGSMSSALGKRLADRSDSGLALDGALSDAACDCLNCLRPAA